MTEILEVLSLAPGASLQGLGRPGFAAFGLSAGGAADRLALYEAAALLHRPAAGVALEIPLAGGRFRAGTATRIALTGAPCPARLDGQPLRWNASHLLPAGAMLELGAATQGVYSYLSLAGGFMPGETLAPPPPRAGTALRFAPDPCPGAAALALPDAPLRFRGGALRVLPGPQTALFGPETLARAFATRFTAGPANRQGLALLQDGPPFASQTFALLSDFIVPGDIQSTGAGNLVLLLAESQTIGGYPRLGTVLPADLPRAAQARPGTPLSLCPIGFAEAEAASPPEAQWLAGLTRALQPLHRKPGDIADLLRYQLISGAVRGDEDDEKDGAENGNAT